MKKLIAATLLAAGLATPAMSADMAVKARAPIVNPAYDWSGFYFGAAVGGAWADVDRYYPNGVGIVGTYGFTKSDFHYAGFGGAQKQFGDWVFGVEGAWNSNIINLNGAAPVALTGANGGFTNRLQDIVTFGGRVGYAGWNNWLVYATGGWAQARLTTEYYNTVTGAPILPNVGAFANWGNRTHQGWYAGVGVEYMIYKGVIADTIVGAEYQHIDLDRRNHVFAGAAAGENYDARADIDVVRARIAFKFNPWRPAAVVAKY